MWKLLWTESKYNGFIISVAFLLCCISFVAIWFGVKYGHNRVPLFMVIMLMATIMINFISEGIRSKEQRYRFHGSLPLPEIKVYATPLIFPVLTWISITLYFVLIFTFVQTLSDKDLIIPTANQLFSVNGLALIVCALYLMNINLKIVFPRRYLRILIFVVWLIVYVAALLPFYVMTDFLGIFGQHTPLQESLLNIVSSMEGCLALNGIGLILLSICIIFFVRRKSIV